MMTGPEDSVTITFPSFSQNEQLARAFAATFAARLNPTLRELDDVRTAVSEAVTNVVIHAYPDGPGEARMLLRAEEGELTVEISDKGVGIADVARARQAMYTSLPGGERSGLGFTVMESFMDKVEVESAPGKGTVVRMTKRIG